MRFSSERWPETLALHAASLHPQTREVAAETLNQILQSQIRVGIAHGPDAWDRWISAAFWRVHQSEQSSPKVILKNWGTGSRANGWSRESGMPASVWASNRGQVQNVSSHDDDYLYYRSPLTGNFEVECDVTSFGWRESHLMLAGTYVAPIYDHFTYGIGSIRGPRPTGTIDPRLTECDKWVRYRSVVRNRLVSTCFNAS